VVGGVPEIAGPPLTVMLKAGSEARPEPPLTLMTIPEYVPTFAAAGVPLRRPEVVLNVAHDGRPAMENVSVPPAGSEALGWNE
jgi:hypothetical protein